MSGLGHTFLQALNATNSTTSADSRFTLHRSTHLPAQILRIMPPWLIYHTDDTFVDNESKTALSQNITKLYINLSLPTFYVVVNFIKLNSSDMWVGGHPRTGKPLVRVIVDHIAIHVPDDDAIYHRTTAAFVQILKPHVADKGYNWEFHVDETERRLWKVNGFIPCLQECRRAALGQGKQSYTVRVTGISLETKTIKWGSYLQTIQLKSSSLCV